jgi:superfamily I DNA/RNA helicase/inhibitor of KinA sporulation pathway (predicted exonuclease)
MPDSQIPFPAASPFSRLVHCFPVAFHVTFPDMALVPSPAQSLAINAPLGPVLVLAGPGAGKTFCLIQRIRYLVDEQGLDPSRILAVTFTNRAAGEIADRLADTLGPRAEAITRGTIHALCVQLLRDHGEEVGVPSGFGIADEEYQLQALRRAGFRKDAKWPLNAFSRHRLQGEPLDDWLVPIYERYRNHLANRSLLDFDDLIATTDLLLGTREPTATFIAARWDYLLVDEAQDLTPRQYQILARLARAHRNLFMVGDDEQSIFGFAGADSAVLRRFLNDSGIIRPIVLEENHRCSRQIFDAARRLISLNPQDHPRDLRALNESSWEVCAMRFPDDEAEARWLVEELHRDRAGLGWGDVALLYRRHEVGDVLEGRLLQAGIPCQLARGRALTDDPATAYLIAALRVIERPGDPILVEQLAAIQLPKGLMTTLRGEAERNRMELSAWLREAGRRTRRPPDEEGRRLLRFLTDLDNLPSLIDRYPTLPPLVEELLSRKVGPYHTLLEEKFEESLLSDPMGDPAAAALATRLSATRQDRAPIRLPLAGGAELGMACLLRSAGFPLIEYAAPGAPTASNALVLRPEDRGTLSLAGTLFKALQVIEGRQLTPTLTDFVAVDIETNEFDPRRAEVIELAAVRVRDGEVIEGFQRFVRPVRPITERATRVHGITEAELAGASPFREVWREFQAFAGDDQLVAHNGHHFDFPVLRRQTGEEGESWSFACFDTLPLARDLHPGSRRLSDLALAFGIDPGRSHRALDDCRTLAQVVAHLERLRLARARTISLGNLLDHLAVALALTDPAELSPEDKLLLDAGRIYALGRYSRALGVYAAERSRERAELAPDVDQLIERLGGRKLMAAIQRQKTAGDRYPATMTRLRSLLSSLGDTGLRDQLGEFLTRVALSTSTAGADTSRDRVNLLTLHATKGLEFSRVYIVGVEDAQLPGSSAGKAPRQSDIEEGRRLLYVGMTRARDRLVLTRADQRLGQESGGSRYLDEIGLQG